MRKVLEVLRLALGQDCSQREIAQSVALSQSTINDYLRRFAASGLPWPVPDDVDEATLAAQLFPRALVVAASARALPDWAALHQELRRTGVTLHLLWLEYKAATPDGYQYTQFCHHYRTWAARLDPVLRQTHKAGERAFVDYAGPTIAVVDPTTGEVREAQLFVGVLGASNFLYAEATWTQTLPDWIASHVRMLDYFGGVPALLVPDYVTSHIIGLMCPMRICGDRDLTRGADTPRVGRSSHITITTIPATRAAKDHPAILAFGGIPPWR